MTKAHLDASTDAKLMFELCLQVDAIPMVFQIV
jgi:hypothetical protein